MFEELNPPRKGLSWMTARLVFLTGCALIAGAVTIWGYVGCYWRTHPELTSMQITQEFEGRELIAAILTFLGVLLVNTGKDMEAEEEE
jgi:hypothetical protein